MSNNIEDFDIADKIIEELSSNRDTLYTLRQIHSILFDKYEDFRKLDTKKDLINKLKITFLTIEGEYNNIYRIVLQDKHYLIWSLKEKNEIISELATQPKKFSGDGVIVSRNEIKEEIEKELENFTLFSGTNCYVNVIKQMIQEKNISFMFENNLLDGVNHPIQILILGNDFESIKKLDELTTIDFTVKNKEGKSCLDLAKETKNCEILEFVLEKTFSIKTASFSKIIDNLKEAQKVEFDKMVESKKIIEKLENEIKELKSNEAFEYFKSFLILFLMSIIVKYYANYKYI